jgi:uncharacterized coiled-coil protein SlyX
MKDLHDFFQKEFLGQTFPDEKSRQIQDALQSLNLLETAHRMDLELANRKIAHLTDTLADVRRSAERAIVEVSVWKEIYYKILDALVAVSRDKPKK